jgi:hypothetical protein
MPCAWRALSYSFFIGVTMKNPSATKKGSGRYHKQGHKKAKPPKK